MVSLVDANIIIRYLADDAGELFVRSQEIMANIRSNKLKAQILSEVIMEVLFVLSKQYKAPLVEIVDALKTILNFRGVVNEDKMVLIEALNVMLEKKIDYVDALICTKTKLQRYDWISFDSDLVRHCPRR